MNRGRIEAGIGNQSHSISEFSRISIAKLVVATIIQGPTLPEESTFGSLNSPELRATSLKAVRVDLPDLQGRAVNILTNPDQSCFGLRQAALCLEGMGQDLVRLGHISRNSYTADQRRFYTKAADALQALREPGDLDTYTEAVLFAGKTMLIGSGAHAYLKERGIPVPSEDSQPIEQLQKTTA